MTPALGLRDPFVGIMKGVILSICPSACLVDLTHDVEPQDILGAALALEAALPLFPDGTVHLAVVDPGVGSAPAPPRSPDARTLPGRSRQRGAHPCAPWLPKN